MITPRFSLSQDDNFLTIIIRAPYCNLKELETYIEGTDFRFVCSPYYLRLNLPGKIIDNEDSSGQFLADSGEFVFKYSKVTKGEFFDGLNFITTLLTPTKSKKTDPNIEVLSETLSTPDQEGNEWHVDQKLPEISTTNGCKYGFANKKCNILKETGIEFYSVFDLHNPDEMPQIDRKNYRFDTESMAFCSEHYLADFFEDDTINNIIELNHPWKEITEPISFSSEEKDVLKDLPNREYLLTQDDVKSVLYGLLDILFAYCYDKRSTHFEGTCESGWTITKLSATLSWFDVFNNEKETIISCFRRSLIYPLHRNFNLNLQILEDSKMLLNLGQTFIIKCLLDIYEIFNTSSDPRYIINDLYIKDYIIFMQKCPKIELENFIEQVSKLEVSKDDINLNLDKIVSDAITACVKGEDLLDKMSKLDINEETDSSDSDSETDSSEDSSSDDSSSSDSDSTIC